MISVTHFTDPCCPWAYSASPALAALRWRYGDQLDWRLVTIGLAETPDRYVANGYTPARMATGYRHFARRFRMPFTQAPRARVTATGLACRAIVATRLLDPDREQAVFRALQFTQFTTTELLDTEAGVRAALARVPGLDAEAIVDALEDEATSAAYEADRRAARGAAGGPTEAQGKAADSDGAVRFTAPSLIFAAEDGRTLEAGGFQPLEAYDVCLANLDPALARRPPAEDPVAALEALGEPLTTREIAMIMAPSLTDPDDAAASAALIAAAAEGRVRHEPLGDGALWSAVGDDASRDGAGRAAQRAAV